MMLTITLPPEIQELVARGALFVINDSGGKDSQAMKALLLSLIPRHQLVVIHAHLPEVEWEGSLTHIRKYSAGLPVLVTQARKTFFEMVERRGKFPSPQQRQCTSDLKRDPIAREIRRYLKLHPHTEVVSCMGMRAAESPGRKKLSVFKRNKRNSIAGRTWFDWLPIHHLTTAEVFQVISEAGQEPFWTYGAGLSRKSCVFCIMASDQDLKIAARLQPKLHARYVATERRLNFTLSMSGRPLSTITGVADAA